MIRKKRVQSAVVILLAMMVLFLSAANRPGGEHQKRYTATFLGVFDTVTEIVGYADSEKEFAGQVELLKERLTYYHKLYDIYHEYKGVNNIKTINDNAGIAPVAVDEESIRLLQFSKDMYVQTGGQINIAMGSVLAVWHTYREAGIQNPQEARLPSMEELQAAAAHTDIEQVYISHNRSQEKPQENSNQETRTPNSAGGGIVYLTDAAMSLDVGSIGKGYAVQRVAEYAREIGMERVLISVGGNVCAVGEKEPGVPWRLGIQNPDLESDEKYVALVELQDASVVTSGDYQRYYMVDGVRYSHIIDPDTLMPPEEFASVSIIAKDSGMADALSTAVYNMSFEEGLAFVNKTEGVEAMWIFEDGSIRYSEGFEAYLVTEK